MGFQEDWKEVASLFRRLNDMILRNKLYLTFSTEDGAWVLHSCNMLQRFNFEFTAIFAPLRRRLWVILLAGLVDLSPMWHTVLPCYCLLEDVQYESLDQRNVVSLFPKSENVRVSL